MGLLPVDRLDACKAQRLLDSSRQREPKRVRHATRPHPAKLKDCSIRRDECPDNGGNQDLTSLQSSKIARFVETSQPSVPPPLSPRPAKTKDCSIRRDEADIDPPVPVSVWPAKTKDCSIRRDWAGPGMTTIVAVACKAQRLLDPSRLIPSRWRTG